MGDWARYTLTAVGSAALALVSMTLWLSDVRHDAEEARKETSGHELRIQAIEQWKAAEEAHRANQTKAIEGNAKKLDQIRDDVQAIKEALAARPPR